MSGLVACPFCRQMFPGNEAKSCPDCGIGLEDMAKLPPSYDAQLEYPEEPLPPHMEPLPWAYPGRNRAVLLVIAVLGLLAFFAPWIRESVPDVRELSGRDLAEAGSYYWAPGVAWFVMIPLVVTRRSIHRMRGARFAMGFLAAIVLTTVGARFGFTPTSSKLRPAHWEWMWGLYATGILSVAGLIAAIGFGGRVDDLPTKQPRRGDETLH